ncbi:M23 family metallopeptidase [Govanella unica]|uniref:M23 family metallopeptidase n=1 Tax=Govanella unica TaxID=2975056 RepID=A0A9X3TWN9_9PROT|nr:M23 family metallopeptidase [Govania unica]MDA5193326.1 M23 family metallopeptidase [Govania unica]
MLVTLLSGCGSGGPDRDGRTSWDVRNSPVPVPFPKPRPQTTRASTVTSVAAVPSATPSNLVTVAAGDTLFAISRRNKADLQAIIRANGLEPPYTLIVGQRLRIPAETVHIVQKGETGYGISRTYGVDLATLAQVNGLKSPYQVNLGQRLVLPGAQPQAPVVQAVTALPPQRTVVVADPAVALPTPATTAAIMPALPTSGFDWPARGRILSSYGPKPHGLHNDGINIERPAGSLFKAADAGVVVYAGSDIKAYGNLILLRHGDGWITAYAHAEELLVKRGDTITRGQPLGRIGATGNVTTPQLHFEIRQGRRTIDPASQLPG